MFSCTTLADMPPDPYQEYCIFGMVLPVYHGADGQQKISNQEDVSNGIRSPLLKHWIKNNLYKYSRHIND